MLRLSRRRFVTAGLVAATAFIGGYAAYRLAFHVEPIPPPQVQEGYFGYQDGSNIVCCQQNAVRACRHVLTEDGTVTKVGIRCAVADRTLRTAIYADDPAKNRPGTLLSESQPTPVVRGRWNDLSLEPSAHCKAGAYWLAFQLDNDFTAVYRDNVGGTHVLCDQLYGPFPDPFGPVSKRGTVNYAIRAAYIPEP